MTAGTLCNLPGNVSVHRADAERRGNCKVGEVILFTDRLYKSLQCPGILYLLTDKEMQHCSTGISLLYRVLMIKHLKHIIRKIHG